MKKIAVMLIVVLSLSAMFLTSCSGKYVTVRVIDGEGNIICDEQVKLGEANPNSIRGTNYYGLDCLEAALTQAEIEYYVNKADVDSYVVTNIGDIASDKTTQFTYYVQENKKSEFVDKSGLSAQHDKMEGGEVLEFRYEPIASTNA